MSAAHSFKHALEIADTGAARSEPYACASWKPVLRPLCVALSGVIGLHEELGSMCGNHWMLCSVPPYFSIMQASI